MTFRSSLFSAGLLAFLAAGCVSKDPSIVFISNATLPAIAKETGSTASGLSKPDEQQIDLQVFSRLIEHPQWTGADYSALFFQADDEVVTALIQKYPGHVPPIKMSDHIDLHSSQSPLDRDTGKPAMILSTEMGEPASDGSLIVTGRWFGDPKTAGYQNFKAQKTGGNWTVTDLK